jgi:hypothetical protein
MTFNRSQEKLLEQLESGPVTIIYEDCANTDWGCKRLRGSKMYVGASVLEDYYKLVTIEVIRQYSGGRNGQFKDSLVTEYLVTKK